MTKEIVIDDKIILLINDEIIDRDISKLEAEGKIGKQVNGVYRAPRPNIHGLLTCLRDKRKYNSSQIKEVCMSICPHNPEVNPCPDDSWHLDNCLEVLFQGISLDGKTRYIEYKDN